MTPNTQIFCGGLVLCWFTSARPPYWAGLLRFHLSCQPPTERLSNRSQNVERFKDTTLPFFAEIASRSSTKHWRELRRKGYDIMASVGVATASVASYIGDISELKEKAWKKHWGLFLLAKIDSGSFCMALASHFRCAGAQMSTQYFWCTGTNLIGLSKCYGQIVNCLNRFLHLFADTPYFCLVPKLWMKVWNVI